ncbi:hypothetical protein JCM9279_003234 [Rhodotorula babjevae]
MYLILSDPSTSPSVPVKQFDGDAAGPLILGRGSKSDASALDPASPKFRTSATKVMSSMHAKLHWEGEYAFLTDLGATNGTFLVRDGDQQKLKPDVPYRLFSDDRIIFGRPVTQRSHGSSPIVSQPLTLVAKLQSSPVLAVQRKPDQVADSPIRTALARGNTVTEGSWRVDSYEPSDSDGEQAGSFEAADKYESPRPKSSRRVSFAGLSRSSSIGDDTMRVGQHDVEMTSSPSSSKRGFGLSEEDLLSSREASPVEPTFAPGPLSELDELQIETTASEDAVVETASVELMAIQSGSHSPMDLDSDVARSPPATDLGAKLAKLVSASLPSPVSPELQLVAISSADEDPAQVDGDEHDMPRSTNPSQSKVGRTLVYSHDVDSSGDTAGSRPHEASAADGALEPLRRAEFAKSSSPAQLSPALFGDFNDCASASSEGGLAGSSRSWANKVAEYEDDDEDLLSQAASQLPSPSRSPEGFGTSTSEGIEGIEGSVEPLEKAVRRKSPVSNDDDEGPEPPVSSSPVSKRVATFLEELDDEDALIQAAERDAAALDIDEDLDEILGPAAAADNMALGSPVSARIAAYVEELEEQHALVFEAEHTPDDIRVESFSDAAWSDRGEDDAREPMPSRSARAAMSDDDEDEDEDVDDEAAQSYEPCHIDPAAIASIARSPNLAAFISTILAGRGENLRPLVAGPAGEPVRALDAAALSSDEDLVDLSEGSAGSAQEDGSSEEEDMEDDDDDDDEMSEADESEEEEREADEMSEDEVSPAGEAVDKPTLPDATPADAPVSVLSRPVALSPDLSTERLAKYRRPSAPIVDSDPDLDEGDQDLDQVDLDLEADAFDEKDLEEHEVDHPDGFDEDGAEWEDGVSEKLVGAAEQAEQLCTIETASHALDKLSDSTASPFSTSPSRKRRLSDTDLEAADKMPPLVKHNAVFDSSFPIGVAKSAQTDFSFPAAASTSTSTVAVGTEPVVVVAPLPKRRRLDLPYKSFALGLVTGVIGAIAGLSALGSALESLE